MNKEWIRVCVGDWWSFRDHFSAVQITFEKVVAIYTQVEHFLELNVDCCLLGSDLQLIHNSNCPSSMHINFVRNI